MKFHPQETLLRRACLLAAGFSGDSYWRPAEMTMVNHLTGKSTVLTWTDYQFQTDLEASDFTQTALRRAR